MLAQGDVAAVAVLGPLHTHVATFVLPRITLPCAGVPLVSAGVPTFSPTIFIRTVADDLALCIGGVGWTVLGTLVVAWL